MQREHQKLNLEGHPVYVGSKVNVQWKGSWYEGIVTKIGPQRQLYRVRDLQSNQTLLFERNDMKPLESHILESNLHPGTRIAYNDVDKWVEGVVETNNSVGAALVSWRQSVYSIENETWFEITDIAPVIENEMHQEYNKDLLMAGKSGLLPNDAIEPRPRQIDNILYQSDGSDSVDGEFSKKEDDHFYHVLNDNELPNFRIPLAPHTYETIPSNENKTSSSRYHDSATHSRSHPKQSQTTTPRHKHSSHRPLPPLPPQMYPYPPHPFPYPHLPLPMHGNMGPWGMHSFPLYHPALQSFQSPPSSTLKPPHGRSLEKSSLPCAWSYDTHYRNGIPPHSTSTFFRQLCGKFSAPAGKRNGFIRRKLSSPMRETGKLLKSPSNISGALSEPLINHRPFLSSISRRKISDKLNPSPSSKEGDKKSSSKGGDKKSGSKGGDKKSAKTSSILKSNVENRIPQKVPKSDTAEEINEKEKQKQKQMSSHTEKQKAKEKAKEASALTISSYSPPNVTVNAGGTTMLTCLSSSTEDDVHYEWYKEKEKLPSKAHSNKVIPAPGFLEIRRCSLADEGLYSCTVSNKWGTSTKIFSVTVVRDIVTSSPVTQAPHLGSNLQPSFNSKVTYEELNLQPPADVIYDQQTVQQFLDSLMDEIHLSDDEFEVSLFEDESKQDLPRNQPTVGKENSESTIQEQELDTVPPIPKIIISTEAPRSTRVKRRKISDVIKNDNEDYLDGYGENYGAKSSITDLEMEGLVPFQTKEISKNLKERDKRKSNAESPKHKVSESLKAKRKFNIFSKQRKKKAQEEITKSAVTPGHSSSTEDLTKEDPSSKANGHYSEVKVQPQRTSIVISDPDVNSLGVNTSLGSEHSQSSLAGVMEERESGEQLLLPTEEESLSAQVLRLQQSLEKYDQQDEFGVKKDKQQQQGSKKKKKVFGMFSKRTKI